MQARQWIKEAQAHGWILSRVSGPVLSIACAAHGCKASKTLPIDNLGPVPDPCAAPHEAGHSLAAHDSYKGLVDHLRRRRRALGLDQQDLSDAMGVADGYVAKLESFAKIASPPTLLIWIESLGLTWSIAPCALPPATLKAIQDRAARPYQPNQARFKHDKR